MKEDIFSQMAAAIERSKPVYPAGKVSEIDGSVCKIAGAPSWIEVGDRLQILGSGLQGEVIGSGQEHLTALMGGATDGLCVNAVVQVLGRPVFAPHDGWIGRVVDPNGRPLDGRPLLPAKHNRSVDAHPPAAAHRRHMGARVSTGFAVLDTILPIVRGQRIGLFAGSGVGKSTLLASLARRIEADVVVVGLVGERGRELREFVEKTLGPEGMARSVVVAATSDRSPQMRRRCALAATAVAEHFRDEGKHVLLLLDSVTRFAEAHREVANARGETANTRGFPASTPTAIARLCERAGPGSTDQGDITAVYSVLVSGSDMEEPVADILRGVLDGHIVLDRAIAERGRFPAIDVTRSVSRSLPDAATPAENKLIAQARRLIGAYDQAEMMIQAGLYVSGTDATIDSAIVCRDAFETLISTRGQQGVAGSFLMLQRALKDQLSVAT